MSPGHLPQWLLWAQQNAAPQPPAANPIGMILPMLAIGLLMWVMLIRPQRRERAAREAMVAALKKNDRVITVSGIYGVVTNVRPEADEVTVRVDDTSNTRIRMTMSSILRVLGDDQPADKPSAS
ncbi:MAG: preprotein translocase subunit YajC [Planctomycetaceae bacterium]|nr:preprotein translocase subunit YajC [Planctomycetaceae bacterium]